MTTLLPTRCLHKADTQATHPRSCKTCSRPICRRGSRCGKRRRCSDVPMKLSGSVLSAERCGLEKGTTDCCACWSKPTLYKATHHRHITRFPHRPTHHSRPTHKAIQGS